MTTKARWTVTAHLLLACSALGQEDPLITDRPDFTESASTVAAGRFQLETGIGFSTADGLDDLALGELLGRLGLSERLELRLGGNSYRSVDQPGGGEATGWEDLSLGIKARLAEGDGPRPDLALILATTLPTGARELGGGAGAQPEAVLALAWEAAHDVGVGVNLGYAYPRDGDERYHQGFGSIAVGWPGGERLGLFAELFAFDAEQAGGPTTAYADGGATWALGEDHQLDARVGTSLTGADTDWFAGVGFTARW